jgi:hypothetical protein
MQIRDRVLVERFTGGKQSPKDQPERERERETESHKDTHFSFAAPARAGDASVSVYLGLPIW